MGREPGAPAGKLVVRVFGRRGVERVASRLSRQLLRAVAGQEAVSAVSTERGGAHADVWGSRPGGY